MLATEFTIGPYTIRPAGQANSAQLIDILYGSDTLRRHVMVTPGTRAQVTAQIDETLDDLTRELRKEHERGYAIHLVDAHGELVAGFRCASSIVDGMTPGLIDDRRPLWLRSADRLYSMPATVGEYAGIVARESRPERAWIADMLDDDVLTLDREEWRAPTVWEIRHLVGQGSFTGITGAEAAELLGVDPRVFRKYTAPEGSSNHRHISFAMWHLLLHRLEIQRAPEGRA